VTLSDIKTDPVACRLVQMAWFMGKTSFTYLILSMLCVIQMFSKFKTGLGSEWKTMHL